MDMKESTHSLRCCTSRLRDRCCEPTEDAASEDNESWVDGVVKAYARSADNNIRLWGTENSMPGGHKTVTI